MISATLPCWSYTPNRERHAGNAPLGSVSVPQVCHAVAASATTQRQFRPSEATGGRFLVLHTARSSVSPYAYARSAPPAGSPRHARFHSSCAQRRLPCRAQRRAACAGVVHTSGSSHATFGNSKTSTQNLAAAGSPPL